jgi:RNA polymerase sigma-70 factor (ECF subfamily)
LTTDRPTSLTLLQRARDQDRDAWQRLLDLYAPLVTYWCRHWGVQGADAEDVRQEVFQAVAVGLPNFSRDRAGETFRGWLRGITRHKLLDHFRRESQRPVAAGGSDAQNRLAQFSGPETILPDAPASELQSLYHRALSVLQTEFELNTWQAFWRAAVDGHRPADIAADLGMTAAAVRKAKSRVLHRLREEIGDLLD